MWEGQAMLAAEPETGDARLRRAKSGALRLAVVIYLIGLVLWLALGLLPDLAVWVPPLGSVLRSLASGHGSLAPIAARVIDARTSSATGAAMPETIVGNSAESPAAVAFLLTQYLFSVVNLALGVLLVTRRFDALVPRLMAFALLGTAATFNSPSHAAFHVIGSPEPVTLLHFTFHIISGVTYLWAVILFPDGQLPWPVRSAAIRRTGMTVITLSVTLLCWRSSFVAHPPFFVVFFGVLVTVSGMIAQTVRLRRPAAPATRQQARLLRSALVPALIAAALWLALRSVGLAAGPAGVWAIGFERHVEGWFPALFVVVPVSLFAAILRFRLWDLEMIISRTLLYGSLTALASGAYVAAVVLAGQLIGGGTVATVTAMTVVGVAVAPARAGLDSLANRVVFGQSLTPVQAIRRLADSLERLPPTEELRELTHVAVAATRAATAARVWLLTGDRLVPAAHWPAVPEKAAPAPAIVGRDPTPEALTAAVGRCEHATVLQHRGRPLGVLAVTARAELPLSAEEKHLIEDLAGHAGLLVHNAQLAAGLSRQIELLSDQADQLRASRQSVVRAQDEERRQLERDIHDSAQQDLVALIVSLHRLRALSAEALEHTLDLDQLRDLVRATTDKLNELCGTGLPATLSAGGLTAALEAAVTTARRSGVDVKTDIRAPALTPPEIERAVYFCSVEALQNASKHARAKEITLQLSVVENNVEFTITDDGVGFNADAAAKSSGLANMNRRLTTLGGALEVRATPGHGTRLRGRIPLPPGPVASSSPPGDASGADE